jgi:predicted TIM-barrel fold metal-dependent hydrolase
MDKLLFVSADGHAVMPPELWPEYLERRYHDLLPRLHEENEVFVRAMTILADAQLLAGAPADEGYDVFDKDRIYRSDGWTGAWDAEKRLVEMDREGVAAEFVFHGFYRSVDLFYNVSNANYAPDIVDAGVHGFNRWLHDTFGEHTDRLLLVGAVGRSIDRDATMRELEWIADHGFAGTYMPGFTAHPDQHPLDDEWWDPVWGLCEERGLTLIVHGGYGFEPGLTLGAVQAADAKVRAEGGDDMALIRELMNSYFNDDFFRDLSCRRPLWQFTLGGVFDRFPRLRLMLTEMRGDWIPAMLRRLDTAFEEGRDDLPTSRRPSEWWHSNCLAGLSFMHRCEVEMREEIGVDTLSFGRDYPHTEATWPNTQDYLRALFEGVPVDDVRLILGENLARFLDLDHAHLAAVAERIGYTVDQIVTDEAGLAPELLVHLDRRCGYSKPAEGEGRLVQVEPLLREDLVRLGAA